ncbi:DeoR/GlpR family DNA-binding transcription regulator [Peribacillus alkalitolerans]|uniref:DeoR/GlpR family DNA-binding transcription regulator n=1 Tax=Peribacillus alkalitolerans TaxID=1550385 RepID=UPI0013D70BE5|nr:DeoR/GlpR family DNA-binding transcription regulator [Peribacillus alkalitolerans]
MLTAERHQIILDLLTDSGVVDLQKLVQSTSSSESTIRRDLAYLEQRGLLKRIHGGATVPYSKIDEPNLLDKSSKNSQAKKEIGKWAASLVRDGDCIYLDAGSTVSEMLPYLLQKKIVIVTNGLMHIDTLVNSEIPAYLLGGRMKANTKAMVGASAIHSIKQYRFDKCFLGMNGIDIKNGFTTPDPEEAQIKQLAIDMAEKAFVLADYSKFNETYFAKVADIEQASVITIGLDSHIAKSYGQKTSIEVVTS